MVWTRGARNTTPLNSVKMIKTAGVQLLIVCASARFMAVWSWMGIYFIPVTDTFEIHSQGFV